VIKKIDETRFHEIDHIRHLVRATETTGMGQKTTNE